MDSGSTVAVFFDAVLHPPRSLGRRGRVAVLAVVGAVSGGAGWVFWINGAWPVAGFFGLDALLLAWAFAANDRAARLYERVRLTERDVTVERVAWRQPPRLWRFEPVWLRVRMDDPPRRDSQCTLSCHGRTVIVGAFLTPQERGDFARALSRALDDWRQRRLEG